MTFGHNGIREVDELFIFQYRNITNGIQLSLLSRNITLAILFIVTDGSMYLERVKIGEVLQGSDEFEYEEGESRETIWNGNCLC